VLTEKASIPWYIVFLKELFAVFNLLLWAAAALCFLGFGLQSDHADKSNVWLAIVLIIIVTFTACFSYAQTSKAASLMKDFQNFIPKEALVTRGGQMKRIEASKLVPGDIVHIKGGDNVPADLVLFEVSEMKVNNASLTGESEDLLRKTDNKTANILESANVAFFGTMCTDGTGKGIVIRIGDDTVIGRIATLSTSTRAKETPLSNDIHRFTMIVLSIAILLGIIFFVFGLFYYPIITNLIFAIGIIVANVPEGMMATLTLILALTAQRMAKKMVLVKNLQSVETLGSTSCICSDKTGTLTQNRMTVSQLWLNLQVIDADYNWQTYQNALQIEKAKEGGNPNLVEAPKYNANDADFKDFIKTIALSTTAFFGYNPNMDTIRAAYAKNHKISPNEVPKDNVPEAMQAEFDYIKK
jgi:sodium/potassium-transporting ATPase subunit alpha